MGRQAEPHTHMGREGNPVVFLMVIMASGIASGISGRVRTTATATATTTESRNMAAILQITG